MALAEAFSPRGTLWRHLKESSNYSLAQAGNCALRAPMAKSIMCHVGASLIHSRRQGQSPCQPQARLLTTANNNPAPCINHLIATCGDGRWRPKFSTSLCGW